MELQVKHDLVTKQQQQYILLLVVSIAVAM